MRFSILAALVGLVGCGPGIDPLIGSFTFTMTGTDTNTAPNNNVTSAAGSGTIAVTSNAASTGYVITVAQADTGPCVLEGTAAEKATTPEITIKADQKCTYFNAWSSGNATATFTTSKAVLTLKDTRATDVLTVDLSYAYAGTTPIIAVNFTGNGKRTYTGTRR